MFIQSFAGQARGHPLGGPERCGSREGYPVGLFGPLGDLETSRLPAPGLGLEAGALLLVS
jgi:hypothetical protein